MFISEGDAAVQPLVGQTVLTVAVGMTKVPFRTLNESSPANTR